VTLERIKIKEICCGHTHVSDCLITGRGLNL